MHTEKTGKVLEWKNCGTYHATECGQYYAYREGHLWQAGRVMFGRDINFRVEFQTFASVKEFLQKHETDKVIFVGDPIHPVYAQGGLLHRKMLGLEGGN